jgi:hypothetical protein
MANLQKIAKRLGRDHDLAAALWTTEVYERGCWPAWSTTWIR